MFDSINIDTLVNCVKTIVDNNRCHICDKLGETWLRYSCGIHAACGACILEVDTCPICVSSLDSVIDEKPVPDELLSKRVKAATNLLNKFKEVFKVDVYRRQRISDQLKAEKEVFPQCIQAPVKYINKRKSTNIKTRKVSVFPGEDTSFNKENKMETSAKYVNQWLNSNEKNLPRKPFTDLNVNQSNIIKLNNTMKNKENTNNVQTVRLKRKRKHCETLTSSFNKISSGDHQTKQYVEDCSTSKTPAKRHIKTKSFFSKTIKDNDESGIVINDESIIIEDSQSDSQIIDKDKLAWLAVLEAERNIEKENKTLHSIVNKSQNNIVIERNVPFFKIGSLFKSELNDHKFINENNKNVQNVAIKINSEDQVTNIKIIHNYDLYGKRSIAIQTDISDILKIKHDSIFPNAHIKRQSQDIFSEDLDDMDMKNEGMDSPSKKIKPQVIVMESESDTDVEESSIMQVSADVHRSCEDIDYGVLTEINVGSCNNKPKTRGVTPDSSNSSEKENFDPNRMKRNKSPKKTYKKKKYT